MSQGSGPESASPQISVIAPAYRCAGCIPELYRRIVETMTRMGVSFEIILVNDSSPENDWEIIQGLARSDPRVKGIDFSRNFGQHHAITAGVDFSRGEWVVVMDCDLQDQPEEIPNLYGHATKNGFDVVFSRKAHRKDGWLKVALSRTFHWFYNLFSDMHLEPYASHFSVASRRVITAYRRLREQSRSYALGLLWCGFRVGYLDVAHADRFAGTSSYSFARGLHLAIESISSHSNKPLRMAMWVGFLIASLAFLYGIGIIIQYYWHGIGVSGWTSLIVSIYFLSGILMINLGVIGIYLGKVFDQAKNRPIYIVKDTVNVEAPLTMARNQDSGDLQR